MKSRRCSSICLLSCLCILTLLLVTQIRLAVAGESFEGRATVVDGDTITLAGNATRFRLYGVDAPEGKQTCEDSANKRYLCGSRSARYLADLIGRSGRVACVEEDRDRYGRIVAECSLSSGLVLNREMVRSGWAIEFDRYSDGRYAQAEAEAKASGRGLWAGSFMEPAEWRKLERSADAGNARAAQSAAPLPDAKRDGCTIKGNVSKSGQIYHIQGQADYEKTQINEARGERWFCSSAEAEAAGWRAAKR